MAGVVRDVMTTNPVTIEVGETVHELARRMKENDIGDVVVTDGGTVTGIVTDRDIVVRCVAEGGDPAGGTVRDIASGDLVTVQPDTPVDDAVQLMRARAVRRLPVVENGRCVGVLSVGDLAIERDTDSALADISIAPPNR
ncbi:MAG TPA: CBS domain-containing protein [Mycobacteriales bacterium]|nr:CBS domain-containing protein [Mycobacteriales bacterium]